MSMIPFQTSREIAELKNIPWTLTMASMGVRPLNLDAYEQFRFVIGDSTIFGDDGCNYYRGNIVVSDQVIEVNQVSRTEMGCPEMKPQFNACRLLGRWRCVLLDTSILIYDGETTLTFSSSWTQGIHEYPFLSHRWKLSGSNDTAFTFLSSHDLLPRLTITENREFRLDWYFAPRNPIFPSNSMVGVFGVGKGQSIQFYHVGGAYASPQNPSAGLRDVLLNTRIIRSTKFSNSLTTLTLDNPVSGTHYEFSPDPQ
jgi:heat shock protein HslJ